MPELTRDDLWRQLKQKEIAPVYMLAGAETYQRDRAAAVIVDHAFGESDLRDFNYDEFSLNNREAFDAAIAAAEQLPMMSARRVVKVTDVRVAATASRDTLREECEDALARYLANPSGSTVMIFVADELNGNRKLTKLLKRHASTVTFEKLSDAEIIGWVRKNIADEGFQIDEPALKHLVELVGADLRRLANEIKKLCAAALPAKVISFDIVDALVPNTNPLENFALTDAIVSGRGNRALAVLKKILDDGAEPVALLGLISYNFRRLLMAKEMMNRGDDQREVTSVLRMHWKNQEAFLAAARRADRHQLIRVFDRLRETDLAMKTSLGGGGDQGTRMQIEVLVCEIAAAMAR
jgi:DNA polymerase III subunit delta